VALRKLKPTSPGQRFVVRVVKEGLHKGEPYEPLLEPFSKRGGRNNQGRITTRHQGGGHKRYYRVIDFKRDKDGVAGKIERLEYDPNRTAYLALVLYTDGERRYILAPKRAQVGDPIMSGVDRAIDSTGLAGTSIRTNASTGDSLTGAAVDEAIPLAADPYSANRRSRVAGSRRVPGFTVFARPRPITTEITEITIV